jgi:hypothetical protein
MNETQIMGNIDQCKRIGNHLIVQRVLLGSGHYGKVYLAYEFEQENPNRLKTSKPLACKVIEREKLSAQA